MHALFTFRFLAVLGLIMLANGCRYVNCSFPEYDIRDSSQTTIETPAEQLAEGTDQQKPLDNVANPDLQVPLR